MNENPLVSVVVITYNSAKTVLETLDSIAAQTYKNIELIISDDCSKDETVKVCKDWLKENRERFVRTEIVTVEKNTGVSINLRRGIAVSKGEWIKGIAGDDLLVKEAIYDFVSFVKTNNCQACICNLKLFSNEGMIEQQRIDEYNRYFEYVKLPYFKKVKSLAKGCSFAGPGYFISKFLMISTDSPSDKYPMWDEYSTCYNILLAGYDILPLDKKLVKYRVSNNSLSIGRGKKIMNPKMYKDCKNIFYDLQLPLLRKYHMYFHIIGYSIKWFNEGVKIQFHGDWKSKIVCFITNIFNPFTYVNIIKLF